MTPDIWRLMVTQAWQITAVTIVVAVVNSCVGRRRPHLAHALWLLVLIKCITPPVWGHPWALFSGLQTMLATGPIPAETIQSSHSESETADVFAMEAITPDSDASSLELIDSGEFQHADQQEVLRSSGDPLVELPATIPNTSFNLRTISWSLFALTIAFCGAAVTLGVMVARYVRCLRMINRCRTREWDVLLKERLRLLAEQLSIRRVPEIIASDVRFGPAVFGVFRHSIVLPECLLTVRNACDAEQVLATASDLPNTTTAAGGVFEFRQGEAPAEPLSKRKPVDAAAQQELRPPGRSQGHVTGATRDQEGTPCLPEFLTPILAHELLHLRRGDLLTGVLQAVAQCFWWFHPAVWYTNRWLSREAERCCDEQVVAELGCSPAEYARSLLSVIECKHQLEPVPVFPGMKPVEITSQRMERIMSLKNGLKKRTPVWCWLAIAVLALVVLPGAADHSKTVAQEQGIRQSKQQNDGHSSSTTDKAPEIGVRPRAETSGTDELLEHEKQRLHKLLETKVSMSFHQRSIQSVLRSIEEEYGLNIALKASAFEVVGWGSVEYQCKNEPLGNALASIAEQLGMKMTIVHGIIHFELPSIRSRIRVNESLVLSSKQMPSSETVIAFVDDVPIQVSDLLTYPRDDSHVQPLQDSDIKLREEYLSESALTLWVKFLHERFPMYLAQEVFLQDFKRRLPPEFISTGESDAEPEVAKIIQHRHLGLNTTNDQELDAKLAAEFSSISLIEKYFQRHLTVQNIKRRLYEANRPFPTDDIVDYGETILMEARFRKQISINVKNADFLQVISSISAEHDVPIRLAPLHAEMANRLSNPPVTVDIRDQTLEEAVRLIVEPRGMTATLTAKGLSIQHTAPETITQEFLSASPPAYGIFGLVNKTGWQPLTTEIRLKDAIALAGGVADPTYVDVEICHIKHRKTPDGLQRHRILSLNSVLEDSSGEHNCILNDGDVVTVRIDPNARPSATSIPVSSVPANTAEKTQESSPLKDSEESLQVRTYNVRDLVWPMADNAGKFDFVPLVELIRTNLTPESWSKGKSEIRVDQNTVSLMIRHSRKSHNEIARLLQAIRRNQTEVRLECRLLNLLDEYSFQQLQNRCTLQSGSNGQSWALMTSSSAEALLQSLKEQGSEVLYVPTIITTSGLDALISHKPQTESSLPGFSISVTPDPVPESSVIRLLYSVTLDGLQKGQPEATRLSFIGSGQTLLLVMEQPADPGVFDAVKRFVVMLTPSCVQEEEETLSSRDSEGASSTLRGGNVQD